MRKPISNIFFSPFVAFFLYLCFCHVYFNTLNLVDIRYYPHQSSHCRFVSFKEFYRYIRIFFLCFSQKTFDETLQKNNLKIFSSFLLNVKCLPNKHMRNPLLIYFCFCFAFAFYVCKPRINDHLSLRCPFTWSLWETFPYE